MTSKDLVTIEVVSYNAEDTVLDTLESIKNQTYDNLELVFSDDCSQDNTVKIAKSWIESNYARFYRVQLLTVEKNTGVCENLNRALKASTGKWIKGIAADDILLPNCISDFMLFVKEHPLAQFICSLQKEYKNTFEESNYFRTTGQMYDNIIDKSAVEQLPTIAYNNPIVASSVFCSKYLLEELGGYDNRFGYEDHPLYITMLEHGFKIYYMPIETTGYRVHESTMHTIGKLFNPKFIPLSARFRKERCFKYYTVRQKISLKLRWSFMSFVDKCGLNKATRINSFLFNKIMALFVLIGR